MPVPRSLRAFRVIRLFGRLGSLRDIIAALTAAVGPVMNAFLIMFIIGAICEFHCCEIQVGSEKYLCDV